MIIITFVGGGERLIKGATLKQLDQETARLGQINFTTSKDGYPFGECHGIAFKGNIADIVEVPDAAFDARVEAQKAAQVAQKAKAEADKKIRAAQGMAAEAAEAKKLRNKVKRLFKRGAKA